MVLLYHQFNECIYHFIPKAVTIQYSTTGLSVALRASRGMWSTINTAIGLQTRFKKGISKNHVHLSGNAFKIPDQR